MHSSNENSINDQVSERLIESQQDLNTPQFSHSADYTNEEKHTSDEWFLSFFD